MSAIAGVFALFQFIMPLIGWICVHTVMQYFKEFEKFIPWTALALLGFIGGKMLIEGIEEHKCRKDPNATECPVPEKLGFAALLVQGVATSIDALSVGFTISEYVFIQALVSVLLIGIVTFFICYAGILLGKKFGTRLAGKSAIFGGAILIFIGIEIFVTSFI